MVAALVMSGMPAQAMPGTWSCPSPEFSTVVAISTISNPKQVSAELGLSGDNHGLLRARADTIGPWEQFHIRSAL
jgi:hypothetical protein